MPLGPGIWNWPALIARAVLPWLVLGLVLAITVAAIAVELARRFASAVVQGLRAASARPRPQQR
jgi:hypothetical protein